ncbi:GFA family protein [Sediminimonas qiaohouensis]|uniref:GFA family protein n=1 Tax=Sediminimonas qiaohouensis TaxID=552061 RepID=UPI00040CA9DE|nr:GFA family protein [Sediminimonas qiaohouensis]
MKRTGGCACGAIRFEITQDLLGIGSCHCSDCQKASGGGPNYVALAAQDALTLLSGSPKLYHRTGGSGATVARAFCGDCGCPLWSLPAHEPFIPVKIGALDAYEDLAPQMQIYVASAPPWHTIRDDIPAFEQMPPKS